jgi:hypothetical protein
LSNTISGGILGKNWEKTTMETNETVKKATLIQAWEDWDEAPKPAAPADGPKLCKIENPDCEACQ